MELGSNDSTFHTDKPARPAPIALLGLGADDQSDAATPVVPMARHKSRRARPYLMAIAGPRAGELFPIGNRVVLGRGRDATLRLPDERVSRRHAEVRRLSGGALLLRDLGSMNGTYVGGRRVTERLLRNGDRIEIGDGNILRLAWMDPIEEHFQKQLADAALRDGLTQIFNRRYLRQRLCAELAFAQRHRLPVALLIIDVDHFKEVNDRFGHPQGDAVLRALAETLQLALRSEDVLARWGGEEFAVLARGIGEAPARVLGERIRQTVAATQFPHGLPLRVSIGAAAYPESCSGTAASTAADRDQEHSPYEVGVALADALLGSADEALYGAKQRGRDRVVSASELT